jgi:hypothetical protein
MFSRTTLIIATAFCILVAACDPQSASTGAAATNPKLTSSEASPSMSKADQAKTTSEPKTRSAVDYSPIGQPTCDAFIAYAQQCFQQAKVQGNVVALLEQPYIEHFKLWRRLHADVHQKSILAMMCEQQFAGRQSLADSLQCK